LSTFLTSPQTWLATEKVPAVAKSEFKEEDEKLDKRLVFMICAIFTFLIVSVFWESLLDAIFASVAVFFSLPLMLVCSSLIRI
jgi:hypothetical protein